MEQEEEEKKNWAPPQRAGKALERFCLQFRLSYSIVYFPLLVSSSTTL